MRCPYCGKTLAPNARVCPVCGKAAKRGTPQPASADGLRRARVQQNAAAAGAVVRRKKRRSRFLAPGERWNPKFLAVCALILVCIILIPILIAVAVNAHKDVPLEARTIQSFYSKASGKTSVTFAGKAYEKAIVGEVAETVISADGMTQAMLTKDGTLYYVTTSELRQVATGVLRFVLSADGSRLAYVQLNETREPSTGDDASTTEKEEETTRAPRLADESTTQETTEYVPAGGELYLDYLDTSLFLFSGADGSAPLVANHVAADSLSMSPSGAYVGYAVTAEDGESFEGFLFGGEVTVSLGRDTVPVAASDDGTRQYYLKFDRMEDGWVQKLFSKFEENEVKLGEFSDGKRLCVFFNQDVSEIVFSFTGADGAFFHSMGGGEKLKLANGFSPILSRGKRFVQDGKSVIVPVESFAKTAFRRADGTVQYADAKLNCLDTGVSGTMLRLSNDGKYLYYLGEDGVLGVCTLRKADKKELALNVINFDLSADGEIMYYVNTDNELHTRKGSKDALACENVYAPGTGLCVTDGGYLYFLKDYSYASGTLCYMKGDGRVRVATELDDVHDIAADTGDCIYYRGHYSTLSGTYDLYYGRQKKYTLIFKELG